MIPDLSQAPPDAGPPRGRTLILAAVLLVLLGIQLLRASNAFDATSGGVLGLLELPGRLLGWGGVVLLLLLFAWTLMDGSLQGAANLSIRALGTIAFSVAVAGLAGLARGAAGGGAVGGGLGGLLGDALGGIVATLILLLMAVPSFLLAAVPLWIRQKERAGAAHPAATAPRGGSATHRAPTYPERRYDDSGDEIPVSFATTDVGPVRFADEEPDDEDLVLPPAPVPPPPRDASLPAGVRFADEPEDAAAPAPSPDAPKAPRFDVPLPAGVRYVDVPEEAVAEDEEREQEPEEGDEAAAAAAPDETVAPMAPEEAPEPRPPAVVPEPTPAQPPEPPRAMVAPPASRASEPERTGAEVKDSIKKAVGTFQDEDGGARYRAKLDSLGIFGPPTKEPPAKPPAPVRKTERAPEPPPEKEEAPPPEAKPRRTRKRAASKARKPKAKAAPRAARKRDEAPAAPEKGAAAEREPAPARTGDEQLFQRAVEAALERGAASSVLLSRRLEIGYSRARGLMDRLVREGILGEMSASGSRPVTITREDWEARKR